MDNIKAWKNTAKRMIDFLPVTWKCCFYSAHFQPGGMFNQQIGAVYQPDCGKNWILSKFDVPKNLW